MWDFPGVSGVASVVELIGESRVRGVRDGRGTARWECYFQHMLKVRTEKACLHSYVLLSLI